MAWTFSGDGKPIYAQLVDRLRRGVVTGEYPPGTRLPSVRELAEQAAVNPNTMQRALSELEAQGLVYAQRTAGRFVTEDTDRIAGLRATLAREAARRFLKEMAQLGYSGQEAGSLVCAEDEAEREDRNE